MADPFAAAAVQSSMAMSSVSSKSSYNPPSRRQHRGEHGALQPDRWCDRPQMRLVFSSVATTVRNIPVPLLVVPRLANHAIAGGIARPEAGQLVHGQLQGAPLDDLRAHAVESSPVGGVGSTTPRQHDSRHIGGSMDFSSQFDDLQNRLAEAKVSAQAAATESRDRLGQRIDQAQDDLDQAAADTEQKAREATAATQSKWTQMMADAAARRDDIKAKIDKRTRELDAKTAAKEADWAESDAFAALDYAGWTLSSARLAVLDAIYARSYADERADDAASQ
jgi:hypothetical protein